MAKSVKLELGKLYDRREISEMLGGTYRQFLPMSNGDVIYGCFDKTLNPNAPMEVLIGSGKIRMNNSERAVEQDKAIPIFIKENSKQFEFVGYFKAVRYSDDTQEVKEKAENVENADQIVRVLYFEEAKR